MLPKYLIVRDDNGTFERKMFFIKTKLNSSIKGILKFSKVKVNSYAYRIIRKIYNRYCLYSYNLVNDYKKYYSKEFDTVEEYLCNKHNLFKEEAEYFNNKKAYYVDLDSRRDYEVPYLLEDISVKSVFEKIFGEDLNED